MAGLLACAAPFAHCLTVFGTEQQCLARAVYYEARGQTVLAQRAVALVVLNRWQAGWAPTVCGVVYQPHQFSWTKQPQPKPRGPAWQRAQQIAQQALQGARWQLPNFRATHFHNRSVKPQWVRGLQRVAAIEGHVFYAKRLPSNTAQR